MDPGYARAYAWRACSMANVAEWYRDRFEDDWIVDCTASVAKALEIDPNDPEAHRIMGSIKLHKGDFDLAEYHHQKALELCPSDAYIRARYATLLIYLGQAEEALEQIHIAMRVDPFCPDLLFEDEGISYYCLEKFDQAVSSLKKLKVPTKNSLFYLAAAFFSLGQLEKAGETLSQATMTTGFDINRFIESQVYREESQKKHLEETLRSISTSVN